MTKARPCLEKHPDPCAGMVGGCPLCRLYQTRSDYRVHWGGDPLPEPKPPPSEVAAHLSELTCHQDAPGHRQNGSLIGDGEGYVFCWRDAGSGANLWACRLDARFRPAGKARRLALAHPKAPSGREDPRLFRFAGKLHVMFTGVSGAPPRWHTSVLYARLDDDLKVEEVFYPHFDERREWEKNWGFFDHEGGLFALYTPEPWRVFRIDGDRAEPAHTFPALLSWRWGEPRGGASPVRVGEEWWAFFHSSAPSRENLQTYHAGLLTFDARPPFAPRRYAPGPILSADPSTRPGGSYYAAVMFPGGAVRRGEHWLLCSGEHDRWTTIHRFEHSELESRLIPIPRGCGCG